MIRVVIERWLVGEDDRAIQRTMRDLRREAIHRPGYVSGETLRDTADPRHLVALSTWRTREEWEEWATSDSRRQIEDQISPLLTEPERITVFEPV
jgi:heme-degrading monooxygenase HmoA